MLDKIWLTTALFSLCGLATVKSWGKFESHPIAISIATFTLAACMLTFIVCTLLKIWV